jgi:hypothetical protein
MQGVKLMPAVARNARQWELVLLFEISQLCVKQHCCNVSGDEAVGL